MRNDHPKSLANELSQCAMGSNDDKPGLHYQVPLHLVDRIVAVLAADPPRAEYEEIGTYCVWTKWGRRPMFFYPSLELAQAEANRLAGQHPGSKFIVMKMEGKYHVPPAGAETINQPSTVGELTT